MLQLIGVLLASGSVVALNINPIRKWADSLKDKIKEVNSQYIQEEYDKDFPQNGVIVLGKMALGNVSKAIIKGIFIKPIILLVNLPKDIMLILRFTRDIRKLEKALNNLSNMVPRDSELIECERGLVNTLNSAKELRKRVLISIEARYKVIMASWGMLKALILGIMLLGTIEKLTRVLAHKLAGHEAITKTLIAFGTLLIIIGMVIEYMLTP